MNKISLNSTKLGELRFPKTVIDAPDALLVIGARISPERDSNGNAIENSVAKVIITGIDYKTYQVLKSQGIDTSNVTPATVEFIAPDKASMAQVNPQDLIGKLLDVRDAQVALRWVSRGSSGSWGGLKLIVSQLKVVTQQAK